MVHGNLVFCESFQIKCRLNIYFIRTSSYEIILLLSLKFVLYLLFKTNTSFHTKNTQYQRMGIDSLHDQNERAPKEKKLLAKIIQDV